MRILILDEEFPFPTNTGKRTRSFNLYRRLAPHFQICYLGHGERNSDAAKALRTEGMETVEVSAAVQRKGGPVFYLKLLANLLSPLPYIVTSHTSRVYNDAVTDALARFRPDLVLCEWTPYTVYARGLSSVKKMVSAHNVEADIWQRYYENETSWLRRWYIGKQWKKVERFERTALQWVDGVVAVSDLDLTQLAQKSPALPITVIPNGVDLDYFRPIPQPRSRQHLVFTGSMDWRPNQDAARYFVREILLTGTVEDVRPHVECAAVYIVPLRIGGGSRLKILEALTMGRAMVSTTIGAEGLDVADGRHLLIADDPQAFADSVLRLLDDPDRYSKLGEEGRRLVEQHYGWDALAQRLGHFIRDIGGGQNPRNLQ